MGIVAAVRFGDTRLPRRFWDRVQIVESGCWEWTGSRLAAGYGQWKHSGHRLAHRASHAAFIGPIPDGLLVRHHCDNPPCVNPAHLIVGTHADNAADKMERGRGRCGTRAGHGMAKLTEPDIQAIRDQYGAGSSQREIAAAFGVSQQHVSKIVRHLHW